MARPRAVLPEAGALRACIGANGCIAVKARPGAREQSVSLSDGVVLVKVRAPADKGAANAAIAELLAEALGLPLSQLTLVRGGASRQKLFRIDRP